MNAEVLTKLDDPALHWSRVLKSRVGREVQIDSSGIARHGWFRGGVSQESELENRERLAAPFVHSRELALQEALRYHSSGVMRGRAQQILRQLTDSANASQRLLVDLGSGFGWHWVDLARAFPSVNFALVDFSMTNLRVCRLLMPFDEYPNVLCLHADITDLPFEDHIADYCWSVQAYQHLPSYKRIEGFQELRRVLKPNSRFYLGWLRSVPVVRCLYALLGKAYHELGYTPGGTYLQRFDRTVSEELNRTFPACRLSYSETLFHPELRFVPSNLMIGAIDLWLGSTLVAPLLARQIEIWGAVDGLPRCGSGQTGP